MGKTVVIGASPNPDRYSFQATMRLVEFGEDVIPIGMRMGEIGGLQIITERPNLKDVDTVTLYVGPNNQPSWYDYIISLKPRRVIFNPGTENPTFSAMLAASGIQSEIACTLVLLAMNNYAL